MFHPGKGDNYFKKYEEEYNGITKRVDQTHPITEDTSLNSYKAYEDRKVKRNMFRNAIRNMKRLFLNEAIPALLRNNEAIDVINEINKNRYVITPDNLES